MNVAEKVKIEPDSLDETQSYKLMTGIIVPRPIAWVSTVGKNGLFNAAPYSFFTGIAMKPPIIGVSIALRDGKKKDTLKNIESTRDFVVNLVTEDLGEKMNVTAVDFTSDINEFEIAGLTATASDKVRSPRIAESPVSMECKVLKIMIFGESRQRFVVGEVVAFHVAKDVMSEFRMDFQKLETLGRLAGGMYCKTTGLIDIPRITVEEWEKRK